MVEYASHQVELRVHDPVPGSIELAPRRARLDEVPGVVEVQKSTDNIPGLNCFCDGCQMSVISEPVGNINQQRVSFGITYCTNSNLNVSDFVEARVNESDPIIVDSFLYILS